MTDTSKPVFDVALALVQRDQRWLVAQRFDDAHLPGMWEFPGGKCEPGEAIDDAALRELREECGVAARVTAHLPRVECEYEDRIIRLAPVVCEWTAGEAQAIGNAGVRWVTLDEIEALPLPAVNARVLAHLRAFLARR